MLKTDEANKKVRQVKKNENTAGMAAVGDLAAAAELAEVAAAAELAELTAAAELAALPSRGACAEIWRCPRSNAHCFFVLLLTSILCYDLIRRQHFSLFYRSHFAFLLFFPFPFAAPVPH